VQFFSSFVETALYQNKYLKNKENMNEVSIYFSMNEKEDVVFYPWMLII